MTDRALYWELPPGVTHQAIDDSFGDLTAAEEDRLADEADELEEEEETS